VAAVVEKGQWAKGELEQQKQKRIVEPCSCKCKHPKKTKKVANTSISKNIIALTAVQRGTP